MDATSTLEDLRAGKVTAAELVARSITAIEKEHPRLNAATEILKSEAEAQLRSLPQGALTGLPISIKECYAIAGKRITSGSKRMTPIPCNADAAVVRKLKEAGAVVVARGNTSEFLLGRETDNLVFGTTNNAINPALTAGGSSGGDAALVASGCVAFGIGTDIGGSCRYPALFNGITGFKPASGQIGKEGIFPSAPHAFIESMNSPGILARSVRDVGMVYEVIADKQAPVVSHTTGPRILTSTDFQVDIKDKSISEALRHAVASLGTMGTVEDVSIPESGKLYPLFATLMCAFTDRIHEWSVTSEGKKLTFAGEWLRRIRGKRTISNELFAMLLPFHLLKPSKAKLERTIAEVTTLRKKYHALLGTDGILVLPTTGILAPAHRKFVPQYNKPGVIRIITPVSFCNVLNLGCITIPAHRFRSNASTNPPGIQLVAARGNEALLLDVAERLEAELG
jgi:Asp-tRNA(Asn)/Glu-tRNA(Gln) amidotransferase A subunit family amidase